MARKNIIFDVTKGEKLVSLYYDMYHFKIQYPLNKQEVLEILTNILAKRLDSDTTIHP